MKITSLINIKSIDLNASVNSKIDAIDMLVNLMAKGGNVKDKEAYKQAILQREESSTTGIGDEIAIPHAKTEAISNAGVAVMVVKDGVDYEALDGQKTKLLFMIGAPASGGDTHLQVLSKLSTLIMTPNFKDSILSAKSPQEILDIINKFEQEKFEEKEENNQSLGDYEVLCVTACPTGIAHTFMAAEALENKAKEKGIKVKVETNGSSGAKNILTEEEIKNAKCIIVAADKKVEMNRFNGKKVIQVRVSEGIKNPEKLLDKAMAGDAPIFNASNVVNNSEEIEKETVGRKIYKDLMNGVSHMLLFVIGGGILIALAFLFDNFEIDPSNFGSNTPFAAFLKKTGDAAFAFMLPVLSGYIAMSIGDRPALVVGFVGGYLASIGGSGFLGALLSGFIAGYLIIFLKKALNILPQALDGIKSILLYPVLGILLMGAIITFIVNPPVSWFNISLSNLLSNMGNSSKVLLGAVLGLMMAIDFGGPINKAAYVFGTAQIAEGNYHIMAPVMIGGMVPPLAIAIATFIFKNKFTKKERESGITNFVMGLSFITEGAIPFAASDPLRVIPACAIGSGVAGALSMLFDCSLRAPHGGIFVFPVVGNPLMYLVALIVGSIVGAILLGIFKKNVNE
ncbi:PTS fructose transporter subunit IIABC [[Clostridium] colinum]|uniref:PTS fructose transporter subunit IIABC n=1 Tax=[Clostridium] colinum TaxID=36835 RepID=UPI002024A620|nr:PTS fructose transporter subunit IIABC [[Clostridium] colinum]